MTSSDEVAKLFRVRRTLYKMLAKRGYLVSDADLHMTLEDFSSRFASVDLRKQLTILVQKADDPSQQLLVFFASEEKKIGVGTIRDVCTTMQDENVGRAILVVRDALTSHSRQAVSEMAPKFFIEIFKEDELLVDITEHSLVPEHRLLSPAEKKALLERYRLKESQLPRIQVSDPVARYFGLTRGQVVKIIRNSETAGRYVSYRLVV